ncbi:MAG: glucose/arabinose dehydrogenase [Sphingobacteriales bacterium]|jgi:glucose/arabinose dehydrogenase
MKIKLLLLTVTLLCSGAVCLPTVGGGDPDLDKIKLPKGFSIEYFAKNVENARSLARGPMGTIFVGSRKEGSVYALIDSDGDNKADQQIVIATGMNMPNGVAMRNGDLYVAEVSKIWRFPDIENNLESPKKELINEDFPTETHHGWKYIAFGPDDKLYVPVGAPCNVCEKEDPIFGTITRMNPDGSDREIYAHGVRNSVGFTWHPDDKTLWFTDNGRDWLGDDSPSDELNHAPEKGLHFGFPYCHQGDTPDPKLAGNRSCEEFVGPEIKMGPHVAGLGLKFNTSNNFNKDFNGDLFVAHHGSWNRTDPIGYRVVRIEFEEGKAIRQHEFASGWLDKNDAWGRPVDVLFLPDGSMLVSDDYNDCIYRIAYSG